MWQIFTRINLYHRLNMGSWSVREGLSVLTFSLSVIGHLLRLRTSYWLKIEHRTTGLAALHINHQTESFRKKIGSAESQFQVKLFNSRKMSRNK